MEFQKLLQTRRSIRKFQSQEVEQEKVDQILQAALMSPASKRTNPWEFIIVKNSETLQKLAESRPHGSQLLAGAPMAIVVIADTNKSDVWVEDCSIASIIIQLQAHELGLGSCWVQVRGRNKDENLTTENVIRDLLEIPSHYSVENVIAIGYPNEEKKPFDSEKLAFNKIHTEKF